jgi:hypothetical protein
MGSLGGDYAIGFIHDIVLLPGNDLSVRANVDSSQVFTAVSPIEPFHASRAS